MPDLVATVAALSEYLNAGIIPFANTANNATFAYGKVESDLNVFNASRLGLKLEADLNVNNATFAYGKVESDLNVWNASRLGLKTEANLNVNNAVFANDASFLQGGDSNYYRNVSNFNNGTLSDARLSSNVSLKNAANIFTAIQTIASADPHWKMQLSGGNRPARFAQWADGAAWIACNVFWTGSAWHLDNTGQPGHLIQISPISGVNFFHFTAGSNPRTPVGTFGANISGVLTEQNRSIGLGQWQAFTPALSADGGVTWSHGTNESEYCVIGNVCFVRLRLENTSLSGGGAGVLGVASLPFTINGTITDRWDVFHGGVWEANHFVQLSGGTAGASIQRPAGGFYTSGAGLYIRQNFWYHI